MDDQNSSLYFYNGMDCYVHVRFTYVHSISYLQNKDNDLIFYVYFCFIIVKTMIYSITFYVYFCSINYTKLKSNV